MYGLVNKALKELILERFGLELWNKVMVEARIDNDDFISNESYDDETTYSIVGSASKLTGISATELLRAFGEHWVLRTAREGYGAMMETHGGSLPEFLQHLPNFHRRVKLIFPNLQPPRFTVSDTTPTSLNLHYHTHRAGLSEFVVGLLHGLGKSFGSSVSVTQVARKEEGADHDVFLVEWADGTGESNPQA